MSKALVLLPGLLCDDTVWKHQIAALQNEWQCIVVDYGTANSLTTMARIALDAAPDQFALAGHSMGGRVAMEVVRLATHRISHLALMDTGCAPLPQGEAAEREKQFRYRLLDLARNQGMRTMGEEWLKGMLHPNRLGDSVLWNEIIDMIERKTSEIYLAQIKALLDRPDAYPVLPLIDCPTLVLTGRQDNWSNVAQHEKIAAAIAGAQLEIIEDCGHMSTLEQPEAVTTSFIKWLNIN